MGSTGMMKKSVTNLMPLLPTKLPTIPHCEQRIDGPNGPEPQVKNRVPMMKMKNIWTPQRFAARVFFDAPTAFFDAPPLALAPFDAPPAACVCFVTSRLADASRAAGDAS